MASASPLSSLLGYARHYRGRVYWASTCSVLNKIFDLAPPLLIGMAVDVVVKREQSLIARMGFPEMMTQLWILAILSLVIWALESLFEYLYQVAWRNLAQTLQHDLRLDGFAHAQNLDLAFFEDRSTAGLMAILNDDVNQLERFLDKGANDILQVVTTAIVIGAIFVYFSPLIASLSILPVPFILLVSFAFQKKLAPRYAAVREKVGDLNSNLSNVLSGIAVVKSYTSEKFELGRLRWESQSYCSANARAISLSSAFSPLIRMVVLVGFTVTLVLGGWLVQDGRLEVGSYSVLIFLTQRLLWPMTRLGETFDLYQRAMASVIRILNLLGTPFSIQDGKRVLNIRAQYAIDFSNISFAYQNGVSIFTNLNLKFPAGSMVGVVGTTGSGKSTLIKLLLRFYEPQSGKISIDGTDIKDLKLHSLREKIALVSQDVFLFHGSIAENIRYGSFQASTDEIVEAAKLAEAHSFITQFPDGYETIVGERGQKLSGGQRQRVSLARAILKNAPILILDEATSSVDNETEASIQRSLQKVSTGRTTIIIAHRLSTVRNASQIYVLESGRVREQGDHRKLLESQGVYAGLWRVQTGEQMNSPVSYPK